MKATQIVEAVLFASDAPLKAEEIARADESLDEDRVEAALQELRVFYDETERGFQVEEVAEGWQILTRPEFAPYLERFDTVPRPSRLSGPALETLAIIAYRQPIGRIEIEYIRGVSSSGVIRSLQDRALVDVVGRGEGLGRPLLYGTTARFLEHFGFASLNDLPRPEELPVVLRDRIPLGLDDDEEEPDTQLTLAGDDAGSGSTLGGEDGEDASAPGGEAAPVGDDARDETAATVEPTEAEEEGPGESPAEEDPDRAPEG
ncbi:MAG TPA: SMC-Scp complex subunit ScpB [Longimicrobiales bacterium]|nr:SMC-Scp complex subunit ScpB [Longimicrobiales bacterium]